MNIRENMTGMLMKLFPPNCETKVANLEKGIYNYAIQFATQNKIIKSWKNQTFIHVYKDKCRSVYFNLTPSAIATIISNKTSAREFAFLTHQQLNPTLWNDLIELKEKRDDHLLNFKEQASTTLFTCRKCHSNRCTYYEMQTRSADEATTIFITCLDCGKNWKQ
jgi:DNA-directed RNA polymerase subunit M/transcription elongation factor TFIIS